MRRSSSVRSASSCDGPRRTTRASGRSPSWRTGRCRARRSSTSSLVADEARRVRELDDAVALGLGARAQGRARSRGSRHHPGPTSASSRSRGSSRVSSRQGACSRSAMRSRSRRTSPALLRAGVELVGVDLAEREVGGMERVTADVRSLPLPDAERRPGPARLDARARRRGQHAATGSTAESGTARRRRAAGARSRAAARAAACS